MKLLQLTKQIKKAAKNILGEQFDFISINIRCIDLEFEGEEDYKITYCATLFLKNKSSFWVESTDYKQLIELLQVEHARINAQTADITL